MNYSDVALTAAAILPPLGAVIAVLGLWFVNRRTLKRMNETLAEMRKCEAAMRELVATPERIRAAQRAIRDSVTRIQEEKP